MGRHRKLRSPQGVRGDHVIVERLKAKRIRNVKFDGRTVSLDFGGTHLSRIVFVKEHVPWVGHHTRQIVSVDDDLHLIEGLSVAVHETVEDYIIPILRKNGFSRAEAEAYGHEIAEEAEANWRRQHTNLKSGEYGRKVERVFRNEMAYAGEI